VGFGQSQIAYLPWCGHIVLANVAPNIREAVMKHSPRLNAAKR
jgi:hypothetical protein